MVFHSFSWSGDLHFCFFLYKNVNIPVRAQFFSRKLNWSLKKANMGVKKLLKNWKRSRTEAAQRAPKGHGRHWPRITSCEHWGPGLPKALKILEKAALLAANCRQTARIGEWMLRV